jgi:hypothetical protein
VPSALSTPTTVSEGEDRIWELKVAQRANVRMVGFIGRPTLACAPAGSFVRIFPDDDVTTTRTSTSWGAAPVSSACHAAQDP